jgi:LuxR family maltose regulon positive regulatory protein
MGIEPVIDEQTEIFSPPRPRFPRRPPHSDQVALRTRTPDVHTLRAPRPGMVDRARLEGRLSTPKGVPLALLVAPAGYGKTTLLSQWAEHDPRPFAWITLPAREGGATNLLGSIASRLHEIEPLPPHVMEAVTSDDPAAATSALPALARALEAPRPASVVVIDNAHALHPPETLEQVGLLVDHLGEGCVIALASRTEPALQVGRLRAECRIIEVRAHDLAMTDREAAVTLRRAGLRLTSAHVEAIRSRTEGWPAGLYLAALSLREQDDPAAALARFAGDDRVVADYLRDELLSQLAPDEIAFLMQTSLLDRLSGPLCDAALERHGSGRVLRELSRENVLLAPLDRSEESFRYHPLFADMLRTELRRDEPEREEGVHRRASAWLEEHGDVEGAIDHAIAADDVDRAAGLLWTIAPAYVSSGRYAMVGRWLARFGEEELATRPALALTAAANHGICCDRDVVERWTDAAERSLHRAPEGRRRTLAAAAALMRASIVRDGVARMGEDAARAYALDDETSPLRSAACLLAGAAHLLGGDPQAARAQLEEGVRRGVVHAPRSEVLCLALLALMALEEEDWDEGAILAERAHDHVMGLRLGDDPGCTLVFAASAFARAQRGRVVQARADIGEARRLLSMLHEPAPWYDAQVRVALARAELRLSDASAARSLLSEAARSLRRTPDAVGLRTWLDDAWARADTFAVDATIGPSTLTNAELRVLRFLPSHMSFREIAARLQVSANTVKTQAHAVYRKLDASSRSEAVARARDVGLVDG